jgi:hypothetical protein
MRVDQIDLVSLDEQLERHLSRAWTMEKKKEETFTDVMLRRGLPDVDTDDR